jgi:hypothetical protein
MRKITTLVPTDNYILQVLFDNGTQKVFDLKPYLHLPVFSELEKPEQFKKVVNKGYYIEWSSLEVDLSADTLWHEGK